MATYETSPASTAPIPRRRVSTYYNRPLPPLPSPIEKTPQKRRCFRLSRHLLSQFPTPPPTLMAQEQVNALSLQEHTFVYILGNVDRYPTELLGLLPLPWRRKLLSALPPFRLYQLEQTSIARGIDTEEMWEELSQLQDCVWGRYLMDKHTPPASDMAQSGHRESPRKCFVNYLSHLLFNEMNRDYACKRITELLHATHVDLLDKSTANGLIYGHVNSLFMFQPPYYLIPFRCPNLTERELFWSLYGNKMLPTSLELYVYNIDSSPLWNQELISQEMMRRVLSKLQFLRVYNHMYKTSQLEEIVNAVTHSSKYKDPPSAMGSLKHLEILRADDRHLSTVVPFFSAPHGYSHLTSITISMKPVHYIQTTRHLGPIIRHQLNSLQCLEFQGFSCCISKNTIHICDYMFFSSLAALILKPRFHSLTFKGFRDMPWMMLRMILEANLRTVPSHTQTITLNDVNVTTKGELPFLDFEDESEDEDTEDNQFCPASEIKCLEHKRIHFQNCRIPLEVLDWFESAERLCVHTLEFNQVKVATSLQYCDIDTIEFTTSMNDVVYGHHVSVRKKQKKRWLPSELKAKFLLHEDFECCMFVWLDVSVDNSCLLSV